MTTAPATPELEVPIAQLPARIALQIRDGALNELHAFELPTYESTPAADDEPGDTVHRVVTFDVIVALACAQRDLIKEVRKQREAEGADAETIAGDEQWYERLGRWTVAA